MSAGSLPRPVVDAFETIRTSTDDLIRAAAEGEAEGVRQAVGRRADAVRGLETLLREARKGFDARQNQELSERASTVTRQAEDAEAALNQCIETVRTAMRTLDRGAQAVRSYASGAATPAALNRSS